MVCLCSLVVTVPAWTATGPGFKSVLVWSSVSSTCVMRLITWAGTEGSPMSSLNCDRQQFVKFRGPQLVALVSVLVSFVSTMDTLMKVFCCSRPMLPHAMILHGMILLTYLLWGSHSADRAKAVPPRLYSRRMAVQDQDNGMLHKALSSSFPSHHSTLTHSVASLSDVNDVESIYVSHLQWVGVGPLQATACFHQHYTVVSLNCHQ